MLNQKLLEEVNELFVSGCVEELADMRFMQRCRDVEYIEINPLVFKKLTYEDRVRILEICEKKLGEYYFRFDKEFY